ncbi:MAG: DUF302 domain-containing protein [Sulfurovum sp.]|nr:DUF302 domain-containing protein [Sulfurovum sp.]
MKLFTKGLILTVLVSTGLLAAGKHNVNILTAPNADGKITTKTIEAAFEKAGFFINDNRNMLAPFIKTYKTADYDVYNLFTVFKKDDVLKLAKKHPRIGLFTPMSMSIYTKKGTKTISVSSLSASAMAEIMSIPADDKDLLAYGKLVEDTIKAALPGGTLDTVAYEMLKPKGPLVSRATLNMEKGADWEEVKDDFQMAFESALPGKSFIMAGFNDLNYDFEEGSLNVYNFYDVYSICNISVIYTVSKLHPEAGAFAPCSMYMYNLKGSDTIEMGFPSVYNWIASLGIEDKSSDDVLITAQKDFEEILKTLTTKK